MIPLFKSHFSIGKSILTPKQIFSLCKERDLERVIFVEDSFAGFRKCWDLSQSMKQNFIFGIRVDVSQNDKSDTKSKLIFFAKNAEGVSVLKRIFTEYACSSKETFNLSNLKKSDAKNIKICVPFYDSFIAKNIFNFGLCDLDLRNWEHTFFEEDNGHPFDFQISDALKSLGVETQKAKSIYYENREDFTAFKFYKSVCNRKQGGKSPTFDRPELEHFCSNEFCFESYLENK